MEQLFFKTMKTLIIILGTIAAIVLSMIYTGFVFTKLWGWFVIPVFGLPMLTIAQAIGLTIVMRMVTINQILENKKQWHENLILCILYPTFGLLFGWIIQFFL